MPIFYKAVVTILFLLIGLASVFRTMGWYIHDIYWVQQGLGGDKSTHIIAGALIMHTSQLWLNSPLCLKRLWLLAAAVVSLVTVEELSQLVLGSRTFSYQDLLASVAGVAIVLFFSNWYLWLRPQLANRTLK